MHDQTTPSSNEDIFIPEEERNFQAVTGFTPTTPNANVSPRMRGQRARRTEIVSVRIFVTFYSSRGRKILLLLVYS